MKLRAVVVLLAVIAAMLLPLSAAAQTDAPPPAEDLASDAVVTRAMPAPVVVAPEAPDAASPAATFVVNTTSDSPSGTCGDGTCTLREAIIEANANGSSKDNISFNIPGAGPHVITLAAALQVISQPVILDGTTQPGAACGSPKIVVNGSGLASGLGLKLTASNSTIGGLVIQRFPSHGLEINGSNNVIACNFIGTNSAGSADLGNGGIGIFVNNGGSNEIRNSLISGNGSYGIYVGGANAGNNNIHDNLIGLNAAGSGALGNDAEGVLVQDASGTLIGVNGGNVISGNNGHGILVSGSSPNTQILRNLIGVNQAATAAIANKGAGISVNTPGVRIGGGPGTANLISGNQTSGVILDKGNAILERNLIGVNDGASGKIPNGSHGIYVRSSNNKIGTPGNGNRIAGNGQDGIFVESGENNSIQGNFIGTNSALAANLGNSMFGVHVLYGQNTRIDGGNTIAYNGADGVYVPNESSQGTRISSNAIFGNGGLGIDLGNDGVTPNDGGDPDPGPNGLQNFPTLTLVASNGSATRFAGTLNSKPNQTYRIEFFVAGGCDPSGYGEGRGYLAGTNVTTNGSGNATMDIIVSTGVNLNTAVTATATDSSGNTSEFSQCRSTVALAVWKRIYLPATMLP